MSLSRTSALTRVPSTRPPSFGITAPLAHVTGPRRARFGDRGIDRACQLVVGHLGGQIALDLPRLGLLGLRAVLAAAVPVCGCDLQAALSLSPQDRDLVVATVLGGLLQRVGDHAQRRDAVALSRLHRRPRVALNLFENGHDPRLAPSYNSTSSTSPSGSCRKRVPNSRKASGSPVQTNE